ncbi:MAG: LysE family translocator [Candidatus Sumerlaeia bacterium]|nr:LysE family translocator [Candidatus Sumerlaeia bacterium]
MNRGLVTIAVIKELILIAGGSFLIGLSGAMAPGPLLTITIAESIKRGPWVGPLIVLGHGVLEFILVVAIISGLGAVLTLSAVKIGLFGSGGILLMVMAFLTWRSSQQNLSLNSAGKVNHSSQRLLQLPLMGVIISMSNPYWTIWWVTIGMGYLAVAIKFSWVGVTAFFLGHILSDFLWYTIVSFTLGKGKKFISAQFYRYLLMICALGLFVFALIFLYTCITLI